MAGKTYCYIAPPIHLNIYLLVSANYEFHNYVDGLYNALSGYNYLSDPSLF
jgi:hypothetical protein